MATPRSCSAPASAPAPAGGEAACAIHCPRRSGYGRDTPHLLLAGAGAERLAAETRPELLRRRLVRHRAPARALMAQSKALSAPVALDSGRHWHPPSPSTGACATSSRRVGDSPMIGSGTYAEDGVCTASTTGDGELIVRAVLAAEGGGSDATRTGCPLD